MIFFFLFLIHFISKNIMISTEKSLNYNMDFKKTNYSRVINDD